MRIGVLALQGAAREHIGSLTRCGSVAVPVKKVEQLDGLDALVVPGGESTTLWKLMKEYRFDSAIGEFSDKGKPIFGTCAGLILLAGEVIGEQPKLGLIDISVSRNAFGRQIDSFESDLEIDGVCENGDRFKGVFIRAPRIRSTGSSVKVMSRYRGDIVMVRNENVLVSAFHPELTNDDRIHKYFIDEMVKGE